jgi:hypothetical protein
MTGKETPRWSDVGIILHEKGERSQTREWGYKVTFSRSASGEPMLEIDQFDNFDEIGRPPTRFEHETVSLAEYVATRPETDPVIANYRRFVAEGLIEEG